MRYDFTKLSAPKIPALGKGKKCIKLLLLQAQIAHLEVVLRVSSHRITTEGASYYE